MTVWSHISLCRKSLQSVSLFFFCRHLWIKSHISLCKKSLHHTAKNINASCGNIINQCRRNVRLSFTLLHPHVVYSNSTKAYLYHSVFYLLDLRNVFTNFMFHIAHISYFISHISPCIIFVAIFISTYGSHYGSAPWPIFELHAFKVSFLIEGRSFNLVAGGRL